MNELQHIELMCIKYDKWSYVQQINKSDKSSNMLQIK